MTFHFIKEYVNYLLFLVECIENIELFSKMYIFCMAGNKWQHIVKAIHMLTEVGR
jgi:hypothetical protein